MKKTKNTRFSVKISSYYYNHPKMINLVLLLIGSILTIIVLLCNYYFYHLNGIHKLNTPLIIPLFISYLILMWVYFRCKEDIFE